MSIFKAIFGNGSGPSKYKSNFNRSTRDYLIDTPGKVASVDFSSRSGTNLDNKRGNILKKSMSNHDKMLPDKRMQTPLETEV